ncbi:MAG: uroporphyrinogen decarboxylase [Thermaerobacter sp.]|nr:uroporphyrinogen decarboxylase [Thermaerobacter sp.]
MSSELYRERLRRIETAAHLGVPDRVPVVLFMDFFAARHRGMKTSEFIWGGEPARIVMQETAEEFQPDGVLVGSPLHPLLMQLGAWPTKMSLPGRDLPDDAYWQFQEKEPTMLLEDYDFIIQHGWNAFLPKIIERCVDYMPAPDVFPKLMAINDQVPKDTEAWRQQGFPIFCGKADVTPFELFSAARTMTQFYLDLYRYPQKVIDAMDAALPDILEVSMGVLKTSGVNRIFLGGTREAGAFLSPKKYEQFCHPWRKQMVQAYVDAGFEVMLHLDQDWTLNLPYFKDFPAGKVSLHTDGFTDIFKAKEILQGHIALKGDVHPTMLTLGSPEEVDAYCEKLIRVVGKDGGFILSQGCDVPMVARPENVHAIVEAAHKYGVYGK